MPQLYVDYPETSNEQATGWFEPSEEDFEDMAEHDAIASLERLSPSRRMAVLERLIGEHERSMEAGGDSDDGIPFAG